MHPSEQSSSSQSIAAAVKDLMRRKQVPERQHGKKLGEILGLSYSQAHRKLNTGAGWTIAQLQDVAEHFGESLVSIGLGETGANPDGQTLGSMAEGTFVVAPGQHEYPCRLWVGQQLHAARNADFVAYLVDGAWKVVETMKCPANVIRHRLSKLEIILKQGQVPTVAVVDDIQNAADGLSKQLDESGFKATAFYSATSLEKTLHDGETFDGYLIDWTLGQRRAEGLIKQIRFLPGPPAPIFLLTGDDASTSPADQDELARVITQLDVHVREKPLRLRTFTAELHKVIGS